MDARHLHSGLLLVFHFLQQLTLLPIASACGHSAVVVWILSRGYRWTDLSLCIEVKTRFAVEGHVAHERPLISGPVEHG